MKNFIYTWTNWGKIKSGKDIEQLKIEIKSTKSHPITTFVIGGKKKKFTMNYKIYGLNSLEILKQLSNIDFPDTCKADYSCCCDGSIWEVQIDDKILTGYVDHPEWFKKVEEIIQVNNIFSLISDKIDKKAKK